MFTRYYRSTYILYAVKILIYFTSNCIQLSYHQQLNVGYQPQSSCSTNGTNILVGTTIWFDISIGGNLSWATITVNNSQRHNSTESFKFSYNFDIIGPATVFIATNIDQRSWNISFDVVKLNPNDISWLPKRSDENSIKTEEDIAFSLNTNCITYNTSLISLTVDGITYRNIQFTHKFQELQGNTSVNGQIQLNYPSDVVSITARLYKLYNAIQNFQVLPERENGCVNENISIMYQVDKGSEVNYTVINNLSTRNVTLINQGNNIFTFKANNSVSTVTKTLSFYAIEEVRAQISPNRSSIIIGETLTGRILSENVASLKWYNKLTSENTWTSIWSTTNDLKYNFTNLGQYDIMVAFDNMTSQCKQQWTIDVVDPGPLELDFVNAKTPPNRNVQTRVDVYVHNNSKISQLTWSYNDLVINECSLESIPIATVNKYSCDVLFNVDTSPLVVSLKSIDNSYNYSKSITPFSTINIWPQVIQVGHLTDLHISTPGNNLCVRWMDEIESSCVGWSYKIQKDSLGTFVVNVRAFNVICDVSITQSITVVDIDQFILRRSDLNSMANEDSPIVMLANKNMNFVLEQTTPSTLYNWSLSVPSGREENMTLSRSNQSSVIVASGNVSEINADIWNLGITITAMLSGGPQCTKTFNVSVYQEITNIAHTLESYSMLVDKQYDFNITWHGTEALCITEFSDLSPVNNITQYGTQCNIAFHTKTIPQEWTLRVEIRNAANNKTLTFRFATYLIVTNFSVSCPNISVPEALVSFSIVKHIPDTYYNWSMTNESDYKAYMSNTSDFLFKVPTGLYIGNYTVTLNASGPLLLNGSLSNTCQLRILTKKLYLRISDPVAIPNVFGDINVTATTGRQIPFTSFSWHLLEPSESNENEQFRDLAEHKNSTTLYVTGDTREGLYTFKLRANGMWIHGNCYDNIDSSNSESPVQIVENCVEQNVTFLLCSPSPAIVEYGANRTIQKSSWFRSLISITSTCVIHFNWSNIADCTLSSDCINTYQPSHLPGMIPVLNSPAIELPPRAFEAGKYQLRCELVIDGVSINNITVSLTVIDTPLIPYIDGGYTRTVGSLDNVILNASLTKDPDKVGNKNDVASQLFYRWQMNHSDCFVNEGGSDLIRRWRTDNVVLMAKDNCLSGHASFDAIVYVKRDWLDTFELEQSFKQKVQIINGTYKHVRLVCHTCNVYMQLKYNANDWTKFIASCDSCFDTHWNESYVWQVKGVHDNREIVLNENSTFSPVNGNILVLKSNALDGRQSYIVKVSAKGLPKIASDSFILEPNQMPENGTCTITPKAGIALETEFLVQCLNWEDDNNRDNPFVYWIHAGSSRMIVSRSIAPTLKILLPPGENNNKLQLEVWVQDSIGAYTVIYINEIVVRPPSNIPVGKVTKYFEKNIAGHDLNKASGIAATIVATMSGVDERIKKPVFNSLLGGLSNLSSGSSDTTTQLLHTMGMADGNADLFTIEKDTREKVLGSMNNLISLSEAFVKIGITLNEISQHSLISLLSKNLEYGNIGQKTNKTDQNYVAIQHVYDVILSSTLTGENSVTFNNSILKSTIQRSPGHWVSTETSNSTCSISYDIPILEATKDVVKIQECSHINPYGTDGDVIKSSIVTLAFRDEQNVEIKLKDLDQPIIMSIPTKEKLKQKIKLKLLTGRLFVKSLQSIPPPNYDGWENSAIRVVIDVVETSGLGNISVHLKQGTEPITKDITSIAKIIDAHSTMEDRTIFISGRDYIANDTYYLGIEHDYFSGYVKLDVLIYTISCHFWDVTSLAWNGTGCFPTNASTEKTTVCRCNHLTSFGSSITLVPNLLDFKMLKGLNIEDNPVALVTILVILSVYLIIVFIAYGKDEQDRLEEHVIPFIGSDECFFQYEIRIKTGSYLTAGTTAKVGIQLFGTNCVSKVRVLKTHTSFQRNALDIFRIGLDQSLGKLHKIRVWHDNTGENPSWHLERVVVRSLVNGEKFFFFCNRWIGVHDDVSKLDNEFDVANKIELQKFSTIFYDTLSRGFNDLHMWLSFFEKPKFSRFTRVQRATCLVTFLYTWMAINAMWFQASKTNNYVFNIGWASVSLEEIVIGFISAIMVFPLNILFYVLFRKSKQGKFPEKKIQIWKKPRRVHMEFVDLEDIPLLEDEATEVKELEREPSLIHRGRKCLDIHLTFLSDKTLNSSGRSGFEEESSTTFSSPSTYKTLKLPHSFVSDTGTDTIANQFAHFENWKRQHLQWIRADKKDVIPPVETHAASCVSLPRHHKEETQRRIHSADNVRDVCANEDNLLLSDADDMSGTKIHDMTDISERVPSTVFAPSNADDKEWDFKSDYGANRISSSYGTKVSAQIKRNEALAKKLQIPHIVELDSSTRWTLPHWCIYIGYLSCFLVSVFCCIVVLTYGQQFGYTLAMKWLKSLVFGFLEDFFLTYPIFLLFIATTTAWLIKPMDLDNLDHVDFVVSASGEGQTSQLQNFSLLTDYEVDSARQEGIRRTKRRRYLKIVAQQIILVILLLIVVKGTFHMNPTFQSRDHLQHQLLKSLVNNVKGNTLNKINESDIKHYWQWLETNWLKILYENQPQQGRETSWRLVSSPTLIQIRNQRSSCNQNEYSTELNMSCWKKKNWGRTQWMIHTIDEQFSLQQQLASTSSNYYDRIAHGQNSFGTYKWMFENGKNSPLVKTNMLTMIQKIKSLKWIDANTRSISHRFFMYNDVTDRYARLDLTIDTETTGYHKKSLNINFFSSHLQLNGFDIFFMFCIATMILVLLTTWLPKLKEFLPKSIVSRPSSLGIWFVQKSVLLLSLLVLLGCYTKYLTVRHDASKTITNRGVLNSASERKLRYSSEWLQYVQNVLAIVAFLVTTRCTRCFLLSTMYNFCQKKLQPMWGSLILLVMFHAMVIMGFSHVEYLLFHSADRNYRTFADSYLTAVFHWWIPDATKSRNQSYHSHFGCFLQFFYTFYYIFFMFGALKLFVLIKINKTANNGSINRNADVTILSVLSYLWKSIKEKRRKTSKHVHFKARVSTKEYLNETPGMVTPQDELPLLPYSLNTLNQNLKCALEDLDNIITIDEWEQEFFRHYQRQFSKDCRPERKTSFL